MSPALGRPSVCPLFYLMIGVIFRDIENEKSQVERFKAAARELGTDDDEERFNEKLKKLAKQKPEMRNPPTIDAAGSHIQTGVLPLN